jgi:hypothetical protein
MRELIAFLFACLLAWHVGTNAERLCPYIQALAELIGWV